MNKLFAKIGVVVAGFALAIGTGIGAINSTREIKQAKAADCSLTFTAAAGSSKTDSESHTWTITSDADESSYDASRGIHYGTGSVYVSYLRLSTAGITDNVSQVVVYCSGASKTSATVGVTIGGAAFGGDPKSITASNASYTFSGTATGAIQISIEQESAKKALYCKSVTVTHGSGVSTYTVTYDANGGTGTMTDADSPYNSGSTVTTLVNTFTRDGYTFNKWNTAANGSGTNYAEGATFTITANTTLYAQWNEIVNPYVDDDVAKTITFDLTKATYVSASASQVSWESPRVTMVADKAGAGTDTNNFLPPSQSSSRFYKDSTLTFTQLDGNGIIKIVASATTDGYTTALKNSSWTNATATSEGQVVTITPLDGNDVVSATLGATTGLSQVVVYYGTVAPVTKYSVIDRIDNGHLSTDEVVENSTLVVSIVPDDGYVYPESLSYVHMAGNPVAYTYVNGVVTVQNVTGNITIEGACVRVNPIRALYSKSSGNAVDVYGYYAGFLDGTGPVIMDGEYGIVIYAKDHNVSGYTIDTTILHVTGSISIYKGLYEIGGETTISVAEGEFEHPALPVSYSAAGGETAEFASRRTTVTGVPSVVSGNLASAAGTSDIKMTFTVGLNEVTVFYKKAKQTTEDMALLKAAVDGSSEITVKGFTSWYDAFQVQMTEVVPVAVGYTAADFSQDLLDDTHDLCAAYEDGVSDYNTYRTQLQSIWSTLNTSYATLAPEEKALLAAAERNESGTVTEQAMARYDFLTGKYNLSNFINGRTPISNSSILIFNNQNNNTLLIIVIASAVTGASLVGLYFLLRRKRKHQ